MPTYQTLLSPSIYPFLESMACLYSAIEKQMHVALLGGDRIADIEKQLQNKFQVDSTTIRNVYHNLKGKHSGIKELHKRRAKELKSTISSIKKSIAAQQKRVKIKLKSQQSAKSHRFIIHQKKRRLALLQQKLEKLQGSEINLCFGTKKLFKAQYHLEANGYSNHQEWLADWQAARTSSFVMVGSKTYAGGNQLCRLDIKGNLAITVPTCLIKDLSLYGLNSGTAASLVLARRGLRLSERLPRVCNALVSPVDDTKHVWTYWARISKQLKGCYRHSYFGMKVRVEVKPNNQSPNQERNLFGKSRDTSIISSSASALGTTSA